MTKHIGLIAVCIITLGLITACGQLSSPSTSSSSTSGKTAQNATKTAPEASGASLPSTPIVAPPSYDNRPLKPGQSPQPDTLPNGLPALKPLKGVNVDTLFSENISNTEKRFDRVENAVTDLRKEFEVVKPAIVRLVAVEEDIQTLVEQLEILANEEASRPKPAPVPAQTQPSPIPSGQAAAPPTAPPTALKPQDAVEPAQPAAPKAAAPAPKPPSGATTVRNLRLGQHSDKIRLVLDASKKTAYSFELDNGENFLLIELPDAAWQGAKSKTFSSKTPIIKSYEVESINGGKGSRIVVALKQGTSILKQQAIPPGSVSPNYRIFVDLKR